MLHYHVSTLALSARSLLTMAVRNPITLQHDYIDMNDYNRPPILHHLFHSNPRNYDLHNHKNCMDSIGGRCRIHCLHPPMGARGWPHHTHSSGAAHVPLRQARVKERGFGRSRVAIHILHRGGGAASAHHGAHFIDGGIRPRSRVRALASSGTCGSLLFRPFR
jgi:hypothetical protein